MQDNPLQFSYKIYAEPLYLEVLVEADDSSWCEGQRQEVREGEPEPELGEDQQANHGRHVSVTRPGLQGDGHITSAWTTGKREINRVSL